MYPFLHDEGQRLGSVALNQAVSLAYFRGFAGNFIIPEHQIGFGAQTTLSTVGPDPGELRRISMSSVAHGADGILYFRWRPAHFGAEIYWSGLIGHDDVPTRHLGEVASFVDDLKIIEPKLMGTHVHMDIAIASADFENQTAYRGYPMGLPNPQDEANEVFTHCYRRGFASGFIHPADDLSRLKVLFVPHFVMWRKEWTSKISDFVENGGTVVFTAMTATRDLNSHVLHETPPGLGLKELTGIKIAELGRAVGPGAKGLAGYDSRHASLYHRPKPNADSAARGVSVEFGGEEIDVGHIFERLSLQNDDVEVLARWASRYFKGEPAITRLKQGRGSVYYVGTYLSEGLVPKLVDHIANDVSIKPLVDQKPEKLEVTLRRSEDAELAFLINTSAEEIVVSSAPEGRCLALVGTINGRTLSLAPHGYAVIDLAEHLTGGGRPMTAT